MALSRLTSPTGASDITQSRLWIGTDGRDRPIKRAHTEKDNVHDLSITCVGDPNFLISSIGPYTQAARAIYFEDHIPLLNVLATIYLAIIR